MSKLNNNIPHFKAKIKKSFFTKDQFYRNLCLSFGFVKKKSGLPRNAVVVAGGVTETVTPVTGIHSHSC